MKVLKVGTPVTPRHSGWAVPSPASLKHFWSPSTKHETNPSHKYIYTHARVADCWGGDAGVGPQSRARVTPTSPYNWVHLSPSNFSRSGNEVVSRYSLGRGQQGGGRGRENLGASGGQRAPPPWLPCGRGHRQGTMEQLDGGGEAPPSCRLDLYTHKAQALQSCW